MVNETTCSEYDQSQACDFDSSLVKKVSRVWKFYRFHLLSHGGHSLCGMMISALKEKQAIIK